jgi:shikimate dehydrogenase
MKFPTAHTRLFGLLGHPVSHSFSPAFQNAAFQAAGLDATYLAFDALPDALPAALAGALALGLGGLNLTIPHKESALLHCVLADRSATLAGAANTLVPAPERKGWIAHNTDSGGFLLAVREELDFEPKGRRCLILGAGGAARAAAAGLLQAGIQEILVANRNRKRAERLSAELSQAIGGRIRAVALEEAPASGLAAGDLLVSATPLGLAASGSGGSWPWDLREFGPGLLAYDMAYGRQETALVSCARALGWRAASGLRMLLHQGALSFHLWTGREAPLQAMEEALYARVRGGRS